jgi:hypothetical protein
MIEGHKMVHAFSFCVGDRSHPQTQVINAKLEKFAWQSADEDNKVLAIANCTLL